MKQTRLLKEITEEEKEELAKLTFAIQFVNDTQVRTNSDGVKWLKNHGFIFNNI